MMTRRTCIDSVARLALFGLAVGLAGCGGGEGGTGPGGATEPAPATDAQGKVTHDTAKEGLEPPK